MDYDLAFTILICFVSGFCALLTIIFLILLRQKNGEIKGLVYLIKKISNVNSETKYSYTTTSTTPKEDIEQKAEKVHNIWRHWMRYFLSKFTLGSGIAYIDIKDFNRWERQRDTLYRDLPEGEKQSDRDIVYEFKL